MYHGYVYFSLLELLPYFSNSHYCLSLQRVWFCLRFFLFYGGGQWRTHPPAHPTPVSCFSLRSICSGPGCFQEPGWGCFPTLTNSCRLWSSLCLSSWAGSYFCQMPDLLLWFVPGKIFVWWKCALFYQTENVLGYKILKWKSSIQPLSVIPFSLLSGLQASNVVLFGWVFLRPPHCVTGLKLMVLLPLAQTSLRITGVCHWVLLLRPGGSFALRSL